MIEDQTKKIADQLESYCSKCNGSFTCRMDDVISCQCYLVQKIGKTGKVLAGTSQDCLCKNCLAKAELEQDAARLRSLKCSKPVLIKNLHYYIEGKYCVFTEFYHRQRGYCCKNNCRHCPFRDESIL